MTGLNNTNNLREILAEFAHDRWVNWMRYLFSHCIRNTDGSVTIPKDFADRWVRQTNTSYKDLPDQEKESDKREADRVLHIIEEYKQ